MKTGNNILRVGAMGICLLLLATMIVSPIRVSATLENENSTEYIRSVSVKNADIPNSSIIIGSYIIHINGMTDEVLAQAEASANEFSQMERYYKSELSDGKWYDVTEALSIADISTGGIPVDVSVIESLKYTHKVSATGEVVDLRIGYTVSSFDIKSPYCLWELEELEALEIQYQLLSQKRSKTESDEAIISLIQQFYGKSIRTGNTDRYDNVITGLERYKNELSARNMPSVWSEEVQKVMVHADAMRRVEAYTILATNLELLLNDLSGQTDATAEVDDFEVSSGLQDAVGQAIENVEKSMLEYMTEILPEEGSATVKSRWQYSNELMSSITASVTSYEYDNLPWYYKWHEVWVRVRATVPVSYNQQRCDTATQKLVNLSGISSGEIIDVQAELETLKLVVSEAYQAYKERLSAGVSDEYKGAVLKHASKAIRDKCLSDQRTKTNTARMEYQSVLSAYFERMNSASLQQYIERLLNGISDLKNIIPEDEVRAYQLETVEEHRNWLRQALVQSMTSASDSTEMDILNDALSELERQRQKALDNNDLEEEKRISAEIDAKQQEIEALTESLIKTLSTSNSSEAEKARALAEMGTGTTASMLNELATELTSLIQGGKNDMQGGDGGLVSDVLEGRLEAFKVLSSLEPGVAKQALAEIENAIQTSSISDEELLEFIEGFIGDTKSLIEQNESDIGGNLASSELIEIIEELLGDKMENVLPKQKAAVVLALSKFGSSHDNSDARKLAISYAGRFYTEGNEYFYLKYEQKLSEYVSVKAIADVLVYRYLFDDMHYSVSLSKGNSYYTFVNGSSEYIYTGRKASELHATAGFQNTVYISSEDAKMIFDTEAGYVNGCNYAILVTPEIEQNVTEVYQQFVEATR